MKGKALKGKAIGPRATEREMSRVMAPVGVKCSQSPRYPM